MSGESEPPLLHGRSTVVSPEVPPGLGWYTVQASVGYVLTAFVEPEPDTATTLGSLGHGPTFRRGSEARRENRHEAV